MHGRRIYWSTFLSVLLLLGALFVSPPLARAQAPAPWSGIAANEASRTPGWAQGSNDMSSHSLSADGRYVLFHSDISTHVPNDNNGWNDVFLRDRVTGELTRVSVASDGTEGNHYSYSPVISADGRFIAFYSCASNFDPTDTNGACDLFVHDRVEHTTTRQSFGPHGEQATEVTYQFRLSGDGRYLVFNASFGNPSWVRQVYLRDRDPDANGIFDEPGLSTTTHISESTVGRYQLGNTDDVAIGNDARYIAYAAFTTDTVTSTAIGQRMYVHDRLFATTFRVDLPDYGVPERENAMASGPVFSDAGLLAYATNAPLVEIDTDTQDDVYVINLMTGGNVLVEVTQLDPEVPAYVTAPAISADGRYLAVKTSELTPWSSLNDNVYGVDRQSLQSYLVSVLPQVDPFPSGMAANNASAPSITADGLGIGFAADAGLLINGWGNRGVFVATDVAMTATDTEVPETGGIYTVDVTAPPTTGWSLQYGPNADVNPSSAAGSATIEVTIAPNTSPDEVTTTIILGSEQVTFHQSAPPQIHFTMPYSGPTSGGTDVEIFGAGFAEGMSAEFGGTPATNVTFVDSGRIVATTPAHRGGWVTVTVTKASGASAEMENTFYFDDTTPPIVTSLVTGTRGANDWYTSDVTVTWTVVDDESVIGTEPCVPLSQTTDITLTLASCYAESDGGGAVAEVWIKRDATPPVATLYNPVDPDFVQGQDQPLDFACDDQTSGIQSCTSSQGATLDTSTVGTHQLTITAVDQAGLTGTSVFTYHVKTFTSLYLPPVTSVYGTTANISVWATFGGAAWPGSPSGSLAGKTLTLFMNDVPVTTVVTDASGRVTMPITGGAAGVYPLRIEFAGDDTYRRAIASTTLTITKATPVIAWPNPAFIAEGTPLGAAQLNASTTVPGTFDYNPTAGTVLARGTHSVSVSFTPTDAANYHGVNASVTLKVKAVPVITWSTPAPIHINESLTSGHLNATADVAGTFAYTPALGWGWNVVGSQTLSVTFTPTNAADYTNATATVVIEVRKGIPAINFPPSDAISYTAALSATQLNAASQVPGTFAYTPPAGTILPAGTHTLTATFTPADLTRWEVTTATKSQLIYRATPSVLWDFPAPIAWGTPLGPQQQNATVNTPGTLTYFPAPGTVMEVGQHWITVSFQPDDTANWDTGSSYASLTVTKAPTTLTWADPASIVYGTSLDSIQLNATASVPGTITYTPGVGAVLAGGTHTLQASFTPADSGHYAGTTAFATIVVTKRTPVITWNNPAPIVHGTPLGMTHYNFTIGVGGGEWSINPPIGTILNAGAGQTLTVTWGPDWDQSTNYNAVSKSVTIDVLKAMPSVTWLPATAITYGTPLGAAQLNATADRPGSVTYTPGVGTVLPAGTNVVTATFTPDDVANYAVVILNRQVTVLPATPVLSWAAPAPITYGTPLSGTQLNATANAAGTFAYSHPAGSVLTAGTHVLTATFTPQSDNYASVSTTVEIVVAKATPVITWANPAGITYGTALSGTQLNATANVAGTFSYSPAAGTVLGAGAQSLSATFTPAEAANYNGAAAGNAIVVAKIALSIQTNNASKVYGQALPAFTATGTGLVNGDSLASLSGTLSFSTSATATSAPGSYVVTPGGVTSANYVITFVNGTLTVTKALTSVAFTTSPNPSLNSQTVQLRAVVSAVAPGAGTPTGTVEFRRGTTLLGTATLVNGVATLNKSFKRGTHSLTATYVGNTKFDRSVGSVTHQVN